MSGWTKGNKWGGKREGSGRKPSGLGETVVMRVPESRIEEIKQFINGVHDLDESSVNNQIEALIERWEGLITPDRTKQPRWENAARLLNDLKAVLINK
jgi:hypothetical protein